MKALIIKIIICCVFVSCASQKKKNISGDVIGYEKYNKNTTTYIDYLNRDDIPEILKEFYYDKLKEKDFYKPQIIISTQDSTRTIQLNSKAANKGYLFINKYSNYFITNNENIIYLIGQDTVNSKEKVMKLIEMKRSEVVKVDTFKVNKYNIVKIN